MADILRQRAQSHLLALGVDALLVSKPESFTWATGAPAGVASLFRRAAAAMALVPTDASQPVAAVVTELFAVSVRAALGDRQVRTHPDWVETADIRAGLEQEPGASINSLVQKAHAASRRPIGFRRPAAFDARIALVELAALLHERGWTKGRLGLDMDFWPVVDFFALQDALPRVQWVDASAAVSAIKAVKSPREIACLTLAASLAEAGMRHAISSAEEGMTRDAIAAAWKTGVADEVHRTGAAINGQWEYVTVGPLPWQGGGTLGPGDVLKFDVGCLVDGYSSDSGRTFVSGAPGRRTRDIMDALEDAYAAGLEVLRPGCLLSDVHARASQAMHRAGFTTFSRGHFGHSLGRDTFCEMPPFIAAEAHVPIEPGMVLIKPKTYGPLLVRSGADEALVIETEAGNRVGAGHVSAVDALSPSDLLMASLAMCIAISMRMTAKAMSLQLGVLAVSACAVKAADLPNRFGRLEVVIRTGSPVEAGYPPKCTECVGAHDEPQCIDVCPADCIIPDPAHAETRDQLQAKYESLHG